MIICVDKYGNKVSGDRNPTSEVKMHLKVYENRDDIKAVVHAHPPMSTVYAVRKKEIDVAYLPEGLINLGQVKVTDYATPSTEEVPNSIVPYLKDYNAVLLANHGALTWGKDLLDAYYKMEVLEYMANLNFNLELVNDGKRLTEKQIKDILSLKGFYEEYMK